MRPLGGREHLMPNKNGDTHKHLVTPCTFKIYQRLLFGQRRITSAYLTSLGLPLRNEHTLKTYRHVLAPASLCTLEKVRHLKAIDRVLAIRKSLRTFELRHPQPFDECDAAVIQVVS